MSSSKKKARGVVCGVLLGLFSVFVFFNALDLIFYGRPLTFFESKSGVIVKKYEVKPKDGKDERLVIYSHGTATMEPRKGVRYGKFFEIKTSFGFVRKVWIFDDEIYEKYNVGDTIVWEVR